MANERVLAEQKCRVCYLTDEKGHHLNNGGVHESGDNYHPFEPECEESGDGE